MNPVDVGVGVPNVGVRSLSSLESLRVWEFESRFNLHLAQKTRWFSSFFNSYDKEIASFRVSVCSGR